MMKEVNGTPATCVFEPEAREKQWIYMSEGQKNSINTQGYIIGHNFGKRTGQACHRDGRSYGRHP